MNRASVRRFPAIATFVSVGLLVVGLEASTAVSALAQTSGTWTTTGSLNVDRVGHTATLLHNGEVLVTGGEDTAGNILASAELYNPATGKWTVTGGMTTPRVSHTAAPVHPAHPNSDTLSGAERFFSVLRTKSQSNQVARSRQLDCRLRKCPLLRRGFESPRTCRA
jgi:hypothetical protein